MSGTRLTQTQEQAIVKLRDCAWTFTRIADHLQISRSTVVKAHHRLVPGTKKVRCRSVVGFTGMQLRWNKWRKLAGLPLHPKGHTAARNAKTAGKPQPIRLVDLDRMSEVTRQCIEVQEIKRDRFYHGSFEL